MGLFNVLFIEILLVIICLFSVKFVFVFKFDRVLAGFIVEIVLIIGVVVLVLVFLVGIICLFTLDSLKFEKGGKGAFLNTGGNINLLFIILGLLIT